MTHGKYAPPLPMLRRFQKYSLNNLQTILISANKEPRKDAKNTMQGDSADIDLDAMLDVDEPKRRDNVLHSSPEF